MNRVVYRKFPDNQIIALFPDEYYRHSNCVLSYMHTGQHSEANYNMVMDATQKATEQEYKDLHEELKQIGYEDLQIRQRANKIGT